MGAVYNNIIGISNSPWTNGQDWSGVSGAVSGCDVVCRSKKPEFVSPFNLIRNHALRDAYEAQLAIYHKCIEECESARKSGRTVLPSYEGERTVLPSQQPTTLSGGDSEPVLSGTHGTTEIVSPVTPDTTNGNGESAKPKWSNGLKIGIGVGVLVAGYFAYKMFFAKKKSA